MLHQNMSFIEITVDGNRDKIWASAERFKQQFLNNKLQLKYYEKANWLVKYAIRYEIANSMCQSPNLTREQIDFLKTRCDFIECKKCKTYKMKLKHCLKCKATKMTPTMT